MLFQFLFVCQVCEVYRLHRESYHLAVDFIDRYLSGKDNVAKQRLQLIGTTALFIAAKIEVRQSICSCILSADNGLEHKNKNCFSCQGMQKQSNVFLSCFSRTLLFSLASNDCSEK